MFQWTNQRRGDLDAEVWDIALRCVRSPIGRGPHM